MTIKMKIAEGFAGGVGTSEAIITAIAFEMEVTNATCTSNSECVYFDWVLGTQSQLADELRLYPTISSGVFELDLGRAYEQVNVRILSLDGAVQGSYDFEHYAGSSFRLEGNTGIYLVQLSINGALVQTKRIIKR